MLYHRSLSSVCWLCLQHCSCNPKSSNNSRQSMILVGITVFCSYQGWQMARDASTAGASNSSAGSQSATAWHGHGWSCHSRHTAVFGVVHQHVSTLFQCGWLDKAVVLHIQCLPSAPGDRENFCAVHSHVAFIKTQHTVL